MTLSTELLAAALIVVVASALSVYAPLARRGATPPAPDPTGARSGGPLRPVVGLLRRRPLARVALTACWSGLLVGAVATVGYPFWTNLVQSRIQSRLDRELASPDLADAYRSGTLEEGDGLTRILIDDIDVDVVVVEGTSSSALRAGAGHYPASPLPCEVGNVAIAGHRTTYGRPFHNVDLLRPGSRIRLETPIGSCTYSVRAEPFPIAPTEVGVVANTPDRAMLTLTTCHPKGSARQRLVVQADLVSAHTGQRA